MSSVDAQKLETQLQRLIDEEAPAAKILNAAERLLAVKPNNVAALQCKVVCCLLRDKFGAALTLLEQLQGASPSVAFSSPAFAFRKAFCYYKLRQYAEAKQVLHAARSAVQDDVACRHLQAQIHYNMEEYAEAAKLYESILQDGAYRDEQEKAEITINLSASYSACNPSKAVETIRAEEDKTYDMCYNAATALIAASDTTNAMKMLIQAEMLCASEHKESSFRSLSKVLDTEEADVVSRMGAQSEAPERKFFNDVVNVWTQMAYVWQVVGEEAKASKVLQLILSLKPSSVVTSTVASTNWAAMQGKSDFFEVSRKLKLALNPNTLHRLTSKQLLSLRYNSALLHLQSGSLTNCRRELDLLRRDYPDHYLTHSLALGLLSVECAKKKKTLSTEECEAAARLVEAAAKNQGNPSYITAKAVAAQIFLKQGDLTRAAEELMEDAMSGSPAVVCTLTAWKVQLGQVKDAAAYLEGEIVKMPPPVASSVLLWATNFFATVRGLYTVLGDLLQSLWGKLSWMKTSKEMAALRCYVLTFTDLTAAKAAAESILDGKQACASSSYESLTASAPSRSQLEALGYRRLTSDEVTGQKKKKATRQRKMRRPPKSMEGKIDPERWIPMSLRSYIVNLPERRKRDLRRLRAIEQDRLRRIAEKRKAEAQAA